LGGRFGQGGDAVDVSGDAAEVGQGQVNFFSRGQPLQQQFRLPAGLLGKVVGVGVHLLGKIGHTDGHGIHDFKGSH